MRSKNSSKINIAEIFRQTFQLLRENPTIILLFLAIAVLDAVALAILFYAPSEPVSLIVGPIIRAFWSGQYLHYPANFVLLPKLMTHAHFLILTFVGIVVTGVVVKKIESHVQGERLTTTSAVMPVMRKYFALLAAWLLTFFCFKVVMGVVMPLVPARMVAVQLSVGFVVALLLQSLMVFLIPSILISGKGFIKDVISGIAFGAKNIVNTSILIAVPVLMILLLSYVKALAPFLADTYPEGVLWILAFGILITMVVDLMITSSTTILYLKARNTK
ncbi:hypothetical protein N9K06_00815 [Omnitrophica bacterium]|nr:hypothetical protein [Candidatus Omnitrophota bacterium]